MSLEELCRYVDQATAYDNASWTLERVMDDDGDYLWNGELRLDRKQLVEASRDGSWWPYVGKTINATGRTAEGVAGTMADVMYDLLDEDGREEIGRPPA